MVQVCFLLLSLITTPNLNLNPLSFFLLYLPGSSHHDFIGTYQCPGGHLEYGETFAETAAREALEETGLEIGEIKFLTATNDVFEGEGKHYVTIFVTGVIVGEKKVPEVRLSFFVSITFGMARCWFYVPF